MSRDFILFGIIAVLCFILFRQCNKGPEVIKGDEIIKTDTLRVYIPGKPDTVEIERTKIVYKDRAPEVITSTIDTATGDTIKNYLTEFSDSLIDATITSKVKGSLISTDFSFVPKFPKYITRVDTFKQSIETIKARNNYGLYVGAVLSGSSERFGVIPSVMLKTPKKLYFTAGYDLINKTYNVGAFTAVNWPF